MRTKAKVGVGVGVVVLIVAALLATNTGIFKGSIRQLNLRPIRPLVDTNVTRGQLAKLVVEEMMRPVQNARPPWHLAQNPAPHFADVPANNPYYIYIETAVAYDIFDGTLANFRPDNLVTRAEFAQIVTLAVQLHGANVPSGAPTFSDVPNDSWYTGAVKSLYGFGGVKIQFRPSDPLTKSFALEVLRNMHDASAV